jgi:hypothetical protein
MCFTEYEGILNSEYPKQLVGTSIDQSPIAKNLLRISAMLSHAVIPVELFYLDPAVSKTQPRFLHTLTETKGNVQPQHC